MDTGEGKFAAMKDLSFEEDMRKQYPKSKGIFTVGEELEIKGSRFKVHDISAFGIKLRLLPAKD